MANARLSSISPYFVMLIFESPTAVVLAAVLAGMVPSSPSTSFNVIGLASLSSSLSPKLNGSFSMTGEGSTADIGCHLLGLAATGGGSVDLGLFGPEYMSFTSSDGASWNVTFRIPAGDLRPDALLFRNKLGFANGRLDVLGGGSPSRSPSFEKSSPINCGSASYFCISALRRAISALRRL